MINGGGGENVSYQDDSLGQPTAPAEELPQIVVDNEVPSVTAAAPERVIASPAPVIEIPQQPASVDLQQTESPAEAHIDTVAETNNRFTHPVHMVESLSEQEQSLIREHVVVRLVLGRHGSTVDWSLDRSTLTAERDFAVTSKIVSELDPDQGDVVGVEDLRWPKPKPGQITGEVEPFSSDIQSAEELAAAQSENRVNAFISAGIDATLHGLPTFFTDASPAELADRRSKRGIRDRLRENALFGSVHEPDRPLREERTAQRAAGLALHMATHPVPSATRPSILTIFYGGGHRNTLPSYYQELGIQPEIILTEERL